MKFCIHIHTDSELIAYEAVALAFTLATFDHQVQLNFSGCSINVLNDSTSRCYGMIQSLALYDLPPAWHEFDAKQFQTLPSVIQQAFDNHTKNTGDSHFDSVLTF